MVKKNLGVIDRVLRIGCGLALVGLGVGRHRKITGYLFPLMGGAFLFEGLSSYSIVYDLLDCSTGKSRG